MSNNRVSSDIPCHDLALEICKISPLAIPLRRRKDLGDIFFDVFEHFWQTNNIMRLAGYFQYS